MANDTCSIEDCPDPVKAKGWCGFHYYRDKRYGDPLGGPPRRARIGQTVPCKIPDCPEPARTLGWCTRHHQSYTRLGDPLAAATYIKRGTPLRERIEARVDKNGPVPVHKPELGPCWVWTGTLNSDGYGWTGTGASGDIDAVHRVAYREFVGPIPDGLEIDHLCRNRACARPDHLEAVTHKVNVQRSTRWARRESA